MAELGTWTGTATSHAPQRPTGVWEQRGAGQASRGVSLLHPLPMSSEARPAFCPHQGLGFIVQAEQLLFPLAPASALLLFPFQLPQPRSSGREEKCDGVINSEATEMVPLPVKPGTWGGRG